MSEETDFVSFDEVTPQMSIKEMTLELLKEYLEETQGVFETSNEYVLSKITEIDDPFWIGRAYDSLVKWKFGEKL